MTMTSVAHSFWRTMMPIKQAENLMDFLNPFARNNSDKNCSSQGYVKRRHRKTTLTEMPCLGPPVEQTRVPEQAVRSWKTATPEFRVNRRADLAWISAIDLSHCLNGQSYLRAKRTLDLILVLGSIPFWLPLLLLCYLLVKLEQPGTPAVFAQRRTGQGGLLFSMFKFRTMVPNAAELKQQLMHLNELQYPDFKIKNDPRITRVGRILRKTSLDELPQLINVLKGEMSLVGPRPTSFSRDTYQLWQTERLDVIPGLTGLWQVYGRAQSEFDDRLRLDILYIRSRCIALDCRLILKTITSILEQRGAY
jgi:lipopolysaccharide/colanic/teichoic acid biosynthesis glycosyltransferase